MASAVVVIIVSLTGSLDKQINIFSYFLRQFILQVLDLIRDF